MQTVGGRVLQVNRVQTKGRRKTDRASSSSQVQGVPPGLVLVQDVDAAPKKVVDEGCGTRGERQQRPAVPLSAACGPLCPDSPYENLRILELGDGLAPGNWERPGSTGAAAICTWSAFPAPATHPVRNRVGKRGDHVLSGENLMSAISRRAAIR